MKTWKIFFGIGFILLAVVLILDAVGVMAPFVSSVGEISLLAVLAAFLLLCFCISQITKGRIGDIFIPLALIFMLFEKNIAILCEIDGENIINNWLLLGCAALLQAGFAILFSGRKRKLVKTYKAGDGGKNRHSSNLTSSVIYIDASAFKEEWAENNLGSLVIRFENADKYEGGGVLHIDNDLGSTTIEVPSSWKYIYDIDNNLGSVSASHDEGDPSGPLLTVKGENNLGSVSISLV